MKKAYGKVNLEDIFFAASQRIKVKSKITDEQVNCVYAVFKNFQNESSIFDKGFSSSIDCLLPVFIDLGYTRISKTKFFKELKTAMQKCTKEEQDVILQKILKLTKTETRDKFIKNIVEKIINQN